MRDSKYIGEVELNYILRKPAVASDVLVVSFPGEAGRQRNTYAYINTLAAFNVNALFLDTAKASEGSRSRLTCVNRDFKIERTIVGLIDKVKEETGSVRVIAVGSSMGGWCSLYYGLKYGYDIISGSTPYEFTSADGVELMAGGVGDADWEFCNSLLPSVITAAGERGYDKYLAMAWGSGEPCYTQKEHAPGLLAALTTAGIKHKVRLFNYSSHDTLHYIFPSELHRQLSIATGLIDDAEEEAFEPDIQKAIRVASDMMQSMKACVNKVDRSLANYNLKAVTQYGVDDAALQLRTFVYGAQGYFWYNAGQKEPYCLKPDEDFWNTLPLLSMLYVTTFSFQQTLLNFCKSNNNRAAEELLEQNVGAFFSRSTEIRKLCREQYGKPWFAIPRLHFFFDYASRNNDLPENFTSEVIDTFRSVIAIAKLFIDLDLRVTSKRVLAILHFIQCFRGDTSFFEKAYPIAIDFFELLIEYYFDKNGVCIGEQAKMQHDLTDLIGYMLHFIDANNMPDTPKVRKIRRHAIKIEAVARHLIRPDGCIPNLGNSPTTKAKRERLEGNFIAAGSNIALLNDGKVFITIGSGNPCHSLSKHCDLLSFTFSYHMDTLVADAGGGAEALSEYSRSAVAHSALICDDSDYVIPEYTDFSAIDSVAEGDGYVIAHMSHGLYPGARLSRVFLWLKPNAIVLIDSAVSEFERKFSQNFLLLSATRKYLTITQHGDGYGVEEYTGGSAPGELRGSIINGFSTPTPAFNVAYTQKGASASFVTTLEAHRRKPGEVNIAAVAVDGKNIVVTFADGSIKTVPMRS